MLISVRDGTLMPGQGTTMQIPYDADQINLIYQFGSREKDEVSKTYLWIHCLACEGKTRTKVYEDFRFF